MLRRFAGQRTKTPLVRKFFTCIAELIEDFASCYSGLQEALLFRPPPKSSPVRGGLSSVGNYWEKT
jgi:hypothetical protein